MTDPERLARLIPALRATYEALSKAPPDGPTTRYTHALLGQILAMAANGDGTFSRRDTAVRRT